MEAKKKRLEQVEKEFIGGMENIRNSFYLSFLTVWALSKRPFNNDVSIPSFEEPGIIDCNSINRIGQDSIEEYVNSIRRHTLNDIVICFERYASQLYLILTDNEHSDPSFIDSNCNYLVKLDTQLNLLKQEEKEFLTQLRRLRNSIVHYNGVYNKKNTLDYTFLLNQYNSVGHEGENISVEFKTIMFIYHKVYDLFLSLCKRGNV